MKLLLDACVWGGACRGLQAAGHDVVWAGAWSTDPGDEEIPAEPGRLRIRPPGKPRVSIPDLTGYSNMYLVAGGVPHIAGTGVTVQRVVGWYKLGLAPQDIVDEIDYLSLAQVYAALAYYHTTRDAIEAAIASEAQEAASLEGRHTLSGANG